MSIFYFVFSLVMYCNTHICREIFIWKCRDEYCKHPRYQHGWWNLLVSISSMLVSKTTPSYIIFCLWEKHHYWKDYAIHKDRTTLCFDDYFSCNRRKSKCKLKHVINWLKLFVDFHNREWNVKWSEPTQMLFFSGKAFHQFSFSPFLIGYKNCLKFIITLYKRYNQKHKNFNIFANSLV